MLRRTIRSKILAQFFRGVPRQIEPKSGVYPPGIAVAAGLVFAYWQRSML
jgi:hypothetical protein